MTKIELIKWFVSLIDEDIEISTEDDNFCVDLEDKCIFIPLEEESDLEFERLFMKFLKEEFNFYTEPFLISLCHEIGHIMTYTKELESERQFLYTMLQCGYKEEEFEEYNRMYFSIPWEYEATKWGIEYINNNKELCDNFMKKFNRL